MIKFLILLVVFVLIVYIGYGILSYYKKRQKLFEDLVQLTTILSTEIGFLKTDLIQIINKNKTNFCCQLNDILEQFLAYLTGPFNNYFEANCFILNNEETEEISTFFNSLGKSSVEEQKVCIAHYKCRFSEQLSKLTKEKECKGMVGFKLCIVVAFFVFIVFI